ncbi:MAG TPA: glycosyltransferase family 39 protein [Casimicrobiaceae bacterium]|nr:glycosyltransferase family 39 protein [Casimicrobiaceae bacterium]
MPLSDTLKPDTASELSPSGPYRAYKQLGLVLLCAAWILLGLFGHDPWKSEDATSFGIAYDMLKSGDWLVPHIAGVPAPDRAPLFYILATASAWAFGNLLPLHDAARLSIAFCLGLTLWLLALTGRELYGRAFRWMPALLFVGCVGLWDRAHALAPEVGALAAEALALYAFALALRRPALGGVLLGVAAGLAFLFRGPVGPALIALTGLFLTLFARWRSPRYGLTLALGLVVAAPLVAAWPIALYQRSPALFAQWYAAQDVARFFGGTVGSPPIEPLYYLKNLLWFAWPALPLALWTLWVRGRGFNGRLTAPGVALPVTALVVLLIVLSAAAEPRASLALPLLVPLALLGAAEVDTLKRSYSGALDWFGILTFGLLALGLWALWFESLRRGLPEEVARLFRDTQPGYQPPVQPVALLVSAALTALWVALVRPARRSNRRAVLNWAAGMTLVWGLSATLWLPYIDSRRSYRPVAESLAAHLPAGSCVASRNLGEPQRALLEYFGNVVTVREESEPNNDCAALLLQVGRDESDIPPDSAWEKIWEGRRRGDDTEHFILFRRAGAESPARRAS